MEIQKQKISNGVNKPKTILIIILILLAGNVFLGVKYFSVVKELRQTQAALETQKTNDKILEFTKLFIEKVLKAETEVDFETRLKLETAVRNLGDEEILSQWQKFIDSKTEADAQEEVKNLLEILVNKIHPVK
jgi:Na+-transporting NADH:ubiquinone oxidoreductase subunit NqrC